MSRVGYSMQALIGKQILEKANMMGSGKLAVLASAFLPIVSLAQTTSLETKGNLQPTDPLQCVSVAEVSNTNSPADIYRGVTRCLEQQEYDRAAPLYGIAVAYAIFDRNRVVDRSAHQASQVLRYEALGQFSNVELETFEQAVDAFRGSESIEPRICEILVSIGPPKYFPHYMVQHGMAAFIDGKTGLVDNFDGDLTWSNILESDFSCPSSASEKERSANRNAEDDFKN